MRTCERYIIYLILIIGIILRFYNYFEIPFTHDEFSALFRTNFISFSELIEKGVRVDGHPAGIQVFLYYWIKIFGAEEWIVKLPFTVFGIFSIWLIYLIAKKWYNETIALISAAYISSIQFAVMYSQIARPYISGLFFVLLMIYFWTNIIKTPDKRFYLNNFLFIISASLCAYNHHFSLLLAIIVGVSGLFLIKKKYLFRYIISGILIFILYIPHLNIFIYQLNVGGVEGWLRKPHNDFLINFIEYIFNYSFYSYIITILLIVFGFYKNEIKDIKYKNIILFTIWFLLPFFIGFFYSKYVNAVLQFSVLIFSFPFIFFVIFGHIKNQKPLINLIIVALILATNIFSLIYERQHYNLFYKSHYENIIVDYRKTEKSNNRIVSIIDSHKKISEYYMEKHNVDSNFIWFDSFSNESEFISFVEKQSEMFDKLYFGCISSNNPLTVPIIMDYFPTIEWQNNYFSGTTYLFSKKIQNNCNIVDFQDFESNFDDHWTKLNSKNICDTFCLSSKNSYYMSTKEEWSPTFTISLDSIISNKNNFIDVSVDIYPINEIKEAVLVTSLNSNEETIYWGGADFKRFIGKNNLGEWITIRQTIKLSDAYLNYKDIILKVYIWNKSKQNFLIDDFQIKVRKGNPVIYGIFEKFYKQ